jgi:tetratricopeptide (TPR) repeat protein
MRSACFLLFLPCLVTAAGQAPKQVSSASADELVRSGVEAQRHGDLKAAIGDLRKAIAIEPDKVEAHAALGAALGAAGQFDAAIEEDTRALAAEPDDTGVRMDLAMAYYKKGDVSHARSESERIHAAHPLDVPAAVLLGYTYIKLGRESQAAELLSPLESGHESNMDLEYVLAFAQIQTGKYAEGLQRIEKVAAATHRADAWLIAGSTRLSQGQFHEARADIEAAIAMNPSLPGVQTMLGQILYALGEKDAAISALQTGLRADPRDFMANLYLGIIRMDQRDFESARPLLEFALQLQPTVPLARLKMAKLNSMTGNYAEAAKTLEDLEKSDPDWLDPHVELATLYYKLHRPEDGQRERGIVQKIGAEQQQAGPHRND